MDITKLDLKELKALAYDQLTEIEQCQINLKAINIEISNKKDALVVKKESKD